MQAFLEELKFRNPEMYYFGLICLGFSIVCLVLSKTTQVQVLGINAWIKPFKFAFSTFLYAWAMGWYCAYLPKFNLTFFNWTVIILLGFEIVYIAIQANRGQLSHFNLSSSFYATMYSLMALAASAVTIYTAYVGWLFMINQFPELPTSYVWAIRMALWIFVVFSFEGFLMGSKLTHTIGGADGGPGLPLLNWSTKFGDPRVAHFIGMHALQLLPFLAYYFVTNKYWVLVIAILYLSLATFTLIQALKGKPFIHVKASSVSGS
jgi:hypothetical protein